jgi:quinol monooxygenase YgiN
MIYVIATIQLKTGQRERFLEHFRALVPEVLREDGCLEYGPTIDVATNIGAQPDPREEVVVVIEKWESVEHLEAHLIAPHMLAYREQVRDLVESTGLQILQPA